MGDRQKGRLHNNVYAGISWGSVALGSMHFEFHVRSREIFLPKEGRAKVGPRSSLRNARKTVKFILSRSIQYSGEAMKSFLRITIYSTTIYNIYTEDFESFIFPWRLIEHFYIELSGCATTFRTLKLHTECSSTAFLHKSQRIWEFLRWLRLKKLYVMF